MTLQEETLQKGKSVHPTPQNTELHCRLQQLFLHIKMLSSGNLEAVKLGGGRKKKKPSLVCFTLGFIFIATNASLQRLRVLAGAGAVCREEHHGFRSWYQQTKLILSPSPLAPWQLTVEALTRTCVSKLEKWGSGCRRVNLPACW